MAPRKKAELEKTVSPTPADDFDHGGAAVDASVDIADPAPVDEQADTPAGAAAGTGTAGGTGTSGGSGGAPAPAPTPSAASTAAQAAGTPQGYAAWVVPAPAALATAAVGSPGYYMGIKAGVDTKADPFAAWLGTTGPRASWPN